MIVKIFHEYINQSRTNNIKEDLQKLEDKIKAFAVQRSGNTWYQRRKNSKWSNAAYDYWEEMSLIGYTIMLS